jgi:DNA-binding NarL/FixJ family response regulator
MSKVRVLLADDFPNLLAILESTLEPLFKIVGKVVAGKSLLETARTLKPDVIVTDIAMPILNGIEAVKILKESGCLSKVVFLTVYSDHEFVRARIDAGASGFVVKSRMVTDRLVAGETASAGRIFTSPILPCQN